MKTIQTLTHHQFSAKNIKTGDEALAIAATLLAFVFLCLPYLILFFRL